MKALLMLMAALALPLAEAQDTAVTGSTPPELLAWASSRTVPLASLVAGSGFEDLSPLRAMVADARVVMLGDSRHDAREQFLLKHRLVEFLVTEMGFTVLAMEESYPQGERINEYLLGGPGDPETVLDALGAWYIWNTEEVLGLIRWLRQYNDRPGRARKVRYCGLDISDAPLPAIDHALAYLARVAPAVAAGLADAIDRSPFSADFWPQTMEAYGRLSPDAVDSLGLALDRLVDTLRGRQPEFIARSSRGEFAQALQMADTAVRAHRMFATMLSGTYEEDGLVREQAMVDNVLRLLHDEAPGQRIIVWAHNLHVARGPLDIDIPGRPPAAGMTLMGQLLADRTDAEVVTIGFAFGRGVESHADLPPAGAGTVDGLMAQIGLPACYLDLRSSPPEGPVHDWLHTRQVMRAQGGTVTLTPARAFDILVFTATLSRTRPTAGALARFDALGMR